ncbi:MAG TPA: pyridoxamine 5'-phosphate oxidase family protein [Streptosporangiaceae bacterium]|jgi:PPOX class probable F420-dependent enzyme
MAATQPETTLDARFGGAEATATPWATAQRALETAEIFWLTTVRADGRPHITPLVAVWTGGALYFGTGAEEQKARNLAQNPHCALTTGCNALGDGLDIVVEGEAVQVRDTATMQRVADAYEAKYGSHFTSPDGNFHGMSDAIRRGEGPLVFEVAPATAFGFGKGKPFSQTRWRF